MKKYMAKSLLKLEDKCPECKKGKMELVEVKPPMPNVGNFYLRCKECNFEYDG